eukprot:UN29264
MMELAFDINRYSVVPTQMWNIVNMFQPLTPYLQELEKIISFERAIDKNYYFCQSLYYAFRLQRIAHMFPGSNFVFPVHYKKL